MPRAAQANTLTSSHSFTEGRGTDGGGGGGGGEGCKVHVIMYPPSSVSRPTVLFASAPHCANQGSSSAVAEKLCLTKLSSKFS